MPKKWWKSRILWLNAALAAGTVLEANLGVIRESLGHNSYFWLTGFAAAANAALRFVTSQPVGK